MTDLEVARAMAALFLIMQGHVPVLPGETPLGVAQGLLQYLEVSRDGRQVIVTANLPRDFKTRQITMTHQVMHFKMEELH